MLAIDFVSVFDAPPKENLSFKVKWCHADGHPDFDDLINMALLLSYRQLHSKTLH